MEARYCIECDDVFLSDDFTDVLCPDCRGESNDDDIFTASRKASKAKRAMNRECSPNILAKHNVPFEAKNDGAHLIIKHNNRTVDF